MSLPNGMDWVLRPWLRDKCQLRELQDGTYDLADVALMNEALDCFDENSARAQEAAAEAARRANG